MTSEPALKVIGNAVHLYSRRTLSQQFTQRLEVKHQVVKELNSAMKVVSLILIPLMSGLCGVGVALAFRLSDTIIEIETHLAVIEKSVSNLQTRYEIESDLWNRHIRSQ
jgi:hypothetical protein